MSKVIQSRRFLVALLGKLACPLVKGGVPLAKNFLAPLATMPSACAKMVLSKEKCVEEDQ